MQLVFEFCTSEARPAVEAVWRVLGDSEYTLQTGRAEREIRIDATLESITSKLESGEIDSFIAYPKSGAVRYAMVLSPTVADEPRSFYMGTVEYTARDYQWIWDLLLNVPNLSIVCLGLEEGVDLRDEHLWIGTFPWDQSPLVIGAVRDSESDSNAWVVRQGPEMRWLEARGTGGIG
jgi:hypothetical protein